MENVDLTRKIYGVINEKGEEICFFFEKQHAEKYANQMQIATGIGYHVEIYEDKNQNI